MMQLSKAPTAQESTNFKQSNLTLTPDDLNAKRKLEALASRAGQADQ